MAGSALAALVTLASLVININHYSLHSIYRNRLVRAFLGASRVESKRDETKNRFTDFDSLGQSPPARALGTGKSTR